VVSNYTWGAIHNAIRRDIKNAIANRDGKCCRYCGALKNLTIDHILPISRGGPVMDYCNLQLLCESCHRVKTRAEQISNRLTV
jgi:5-methylcytosine-specific restriction endonuclease McrA